MKSACGYLLLWSSCKRCNTHDQSLQVMDIYILTNFHLYMLFRFWVTRVQSEEGGEDVPIIVQYIYDARYHANPYILSTTVLSDSKPAFPSCPLFLYPFWHVPLFLINVQIFFSKYSAFALLSQPVAIFYIIILYIVRLKNARAWNIRCSYIILSCGLPIPFTINWGSQCT